MRTLPLTELLEGLAHVPHAALPDPAPTIAGLTLDSRRVRPGDAFVALPGARTHGLAHAAEALHRGAACVLFEPPLPLDAVPADFDASDPRLVGVPQLRAQLGALADRFFESPSEALSVVGVTGTNGKTSTVQLIAQALAGAGRPVGTIGTLGAGMHQSLRAGERTTPDVVRVHALLADLRDEGAAVAAMEVSSHALDQGRVDGVRFDVAAFTNLTHEHLDYHGTLEAYGAAKARLFAWPGLSAAVINLDDPFGRSLLPSLPFALKVIGTSARGAADATLRAEHVVLDPSGLEFDLCCGEARAHVVSRMLGRFNVDNLLTTAGCLLALDWDIERIAAAVPALQPVPGRMNRLGGGATAPLVVVDYAHTPDALEQALFSLRDHLRGRLLCVFGCGGERDRGKRPQMAAAAERLAERVIVTDDNPRNEDGDAIVADIVAGFARPDAVTVQRDRAAAIATAIADAHAGDIVLIAGKGHESYQERNGVRQPFDDLAVARAAMGSAA